MKIRSLDGKTPDIVEENIQKLRQIFPDVFTEDKVDFEKLQQVLGEYVEDSTEFEVVEPTVDGGIEEESPALIFNTELESDFPHNRIIFGAPGTGKSFTLDTDKDELLSNGGEFERVTFHEDYSYAHFVGTYKPTMIDTTKELMNLSDSQKAILSVLENPELSGQEKYDRLYEKFRRPERRMELTPQVIIVLSVIMVVLFVRLLIYLMK